MKIQISEHEIRHLRMRAQRLTEPPSTPFSPSEVLHATCGVQAQDIPAALLGIRARGGGPTAQAIEQERSRPQALVRAWCLRGTLHLITAEDARWLIPFLGPALIAADRRRMAQLGWDAESSERGMKLLRTELNRQGALTREDIIRLLRENRLPHAGQAPIHLIFRAALEASLCEGPEQGKKTIYLPFEEWVGAPEPLPRTEAVRRLARRYLAAYGPAAPQDITAWSGLKAGEIRAAWPDTQADGLVEIEGASGPLWMLSEQASWIDSPPEPSRTVRLLPRFDNLLLAYASRAWLVDPRFSKRVNAGGGIIAQTVLVDGRIVGVWKTARRKKQVEVLIEPFEALPSTVYAALADEVADIARFLGNGTEYRLKIPGEYPSAPV